MPLWRCHVKFKTYGHFPHVSRWSRLSDEKNDDNEVRLKTLHRFSGIYSMVEDNCGKANLGDRLKAARPVVSSNEV